MSAIVLQVPREPACSIDCTPLTEAFWSRPDPSQSRTRAKALSESMHRTRQGRSRLDCNASVQSQPLRSWFGCGCPHHACNPTQGRLLQRPRWRARRRESSSYLQRKGQRWRGREKHAQRENSFKQLEQCVAQRPHASSSATWRVSPAPPRHLHDCETQSIGETLP